MSLFPTSETYAHTEVFRFQSEPRDLHNDFSFLINHVRFYSFEHFLLEIDLELYIAGREKTISLAYGSRHTPNSAKFGDKTVYEIHCPLEKNNCVYIERLVSYKYYSYHCINYPNVNAAISGIAVRSKKEDKKCPQCGFTNSENLQHKNPYHCDTCGIL